MCTFRGFNVIFTNKAIALTQNTLTFKIGFRAFLFPKKKAQTPVFALGASYIYIPVVLVNKFCATRSAT